MSFYRHLAPALRRRRWIQVTAGAALAIAGPSFLVCWSEVWQVDPTGVRVGRLHDVAQLRWPSDELRTESVDDDPHRIVAIGLIGAILGMAGCAFRRAAQSVAVSPGVVGALSGAGLGAATALSLGLAAWSVQASAFTAAIGAYVIAAAYARARGCLRATSAILLGVIINGAATGALSVIQYVPSAHSRLPAIVFWLLGSLATTHWPEFAWFALPVIAMLLFLSAGGRALDVFILDEAEATTVGSRADVLRISVLLLVTWMAAAAVSLAGIAGCGSLLVSHVLRSLPGMKRSLIVPLSAVSGASMIMVADVVGRFLAGSNAPTVLAAWLFGLIALGVLIYQRWAAPN